MAASSSMAQRLLPALGWMPAYRRKWFMPDLMAGLAVWAVMIPESMAYASIVGVQAIMGLYTVVPPLVGPLVGEMEVTAGTGAEGGATEVN